MQGTLNWTEDSDTLQHFVESTSIPLEAYCWGTAIGLFCDPDHADSSSSCFVRTSVHGPRFEEKLIYLTADAPEVLDTFDPEKVYVIGPLILKVLLVPGGMIDIPKKIHPQTAQTCPNLLNKPFTWARDRQAR